MRDEVPPSDRTGGARSWLRLWLWLWLCPCLFAASTAFGQTDEPVRIFAAASLTDALSEALERFDGTRTVPQFGGSSDLARQILAGAPADLFFSADERQVDRLEASGQVEPGGRANLLSNRLVLVRRLDAPGIEDESDIARLERIAMADPDAVPAGVYARLYLQSIGLWPSVRARVVPTLDVRGALAAVASGNIDAGFVYRTDAAMEDRVKIVHEVSGGEGPDIVYVLAIVRSRARPQVRALFDFLRSEAARAVFDRYGFITAGPEEP